MTTITVLGGTGYAGSHLVEEAVRRGFATTSWSRGEPKRAVAGVRYRTGDLREGETLRRAIAGAAVVLGALSPRGALDGALVGVYDRVAQGAARAGARLGIVGGAGSLRTREGGPLLVDTPAFPEAFRSEARQLAEVLDHLRRAPASLDWFFVSPAAEFGARKPGRRTGAYRVGGDVLLADAHGRSCISGADLAVAVLDEVARPAHRRSRFTVAY